MVNFFHTFLKYSLTKVQNYGFLSFNFFHNPLLKAARLVTSFTRYIPWRSDLRSKIGSEITAACKEAQNDPPRQEMDWTSSPMRSHSGTTGGTGGDEEFVSDTFTARPEDYAEVREGIRRLGLGDKKNLPGQSFLLFDCVVLILSSFYY